MKKQFGGTVVGLVVGVVIGLGVALAVAVYVTKVPIPFVNKGQIRSAEQDAAEQRKNKDWDPNAPLYGRNPAQAPAGTTAPAPAGDSAGLSGTAPAAQGAPVAPAVQGGSETQGKPTPSADPLGDLAREKSALAGTDPFTYFVQAGAYRTAEDAEGQRARLSLGGIEARVSEREQSGRTVYRVRVGPFDKREDADKTKERLESLGIEVALVRVQR